VAGFHPWWQSIHDNSPTPLLGNIIAVFGFLVAAAGLVLLVVSLVVWMAGRHRGNQTRPKSEDEALLQSIRDDGHRDRPV
jgi:large-conductance mechanosensitive channel